ncbi:cytochrome b N-terminal domain-containing protein [Accumulibacter sp.]|uniref:cytochrome b N-terminal domain-containing protein n=1 Tax=Accumulibacter sp. TaxID=2053492 RepID=UPI0025F78A67|nr:hydrogenase iron-sulfur subunit [Accumulibacter sp.]MCM8596787.1 hydrogenase iron-sulfur subunit [Accumulibacter sp.]MCM8624679.1 hydrogenase iron-sulfur subunit [Accumulibacter sp.]MDS4050935.1 hydrogenase iron-sulfur subunit [Accumulibacter sp.]
MKFHAALRAGVRSIFLRVEEALDAPFGGADNPLRHLGAIGLYLLWIVVGTGIYLYTVLDTGIAAVYRSIGQLSTDQWYLGGILRSLHRYSADGFVLVMMLHLVREWCYGRYHGFRLYSWVTGVPLIWLAYMAGIGGYWIVWDQLAQLSALSTAELLDWLPVISEPTARNFLAPDSISDRFFTMLVFLHLGVPLLLILGLWAHVHRISHVDYLPSRRAMLATLAALLVLALIRPVASHPPANLATVPRDVALDWFILFIHPLTDLGSPAIVWALLFAATIVLCALPILPHPARDPVAVVTPARCTGCDRCLADCPYAAITMTPHPLRPGSNLAVVDADLCAACGICAGSCPSSTPFRRQPTLVTGIDMPQLPVNALRECLDRSLGEHRHEPTIVVFACSRAADANALAMPDAIVVPLPCTGMLPPSFVEYALRTGADGVLLTTCRAGGCAFRLGERWTAERLAGRREPHLRRNVPRDLVAVVPLAVGDSAALDAALASFRRNLQGGPAASASLPPYEVLRRPTAEPVFGSVRSPDPRISA